MMKVIKNKTENPAWDYSLSDLSIIHTAIRDIDHKTRHDWIMFNQVWTALKSKMDKKLNDVSDMKASIPSLLEEIDISDFAYCVAKVRYGLEEDRDFLFEAKVNKYVFMHITSCETMSKAFKSEYDYWKAKFEDGEDI